MKNVIAEILSGMPKDLQDKFPDVRGMTTSKVRWLLNSLASKLPPEEGYLEVGVHMGGTLIPALAGHPTVDATAVDNWTQFVQVGAERARDVFYRNLKKYESMLPPVRVVDMDIWEFLKAPGFKKPVGFMFYDGDHTEKDQRRIISDIYPHLAKEAVLFIDDYDHPPTKAGSEAGMKDVAWAASEFFYKAGSEGFHNGIGIFHVVKP